MRIAIWRVARLIAVGSMIAIGSRGAAADSITSDVSGACDGSFHVQIDFTQTGGNFAAGTGTATVQFTLENTTGLMPFQSPTLGNPILTRFYFNLPPGTVVMYTEAHILAGSTLWSSGAVINSVFIPAGCQVLEADQLSTQLYEMRGSSSTGEYGIFTNSLQTDGGISAGLLDPHVFSGTTPQGDFFAPVAIAGQVRFTLLMAGLDADLQSAGDFLALCSTHGNQVDVSSIAGKFQGTGVNGQGSCFVARACAPTATTHQSWGSLKVRYR